MSKSHLEDIEESLKKFLIIGENLDDIYSYHQINYLNIFIFIILLSSFFFSLIFVISIGSIWYFLSVSFLGGAIYFAINVRILITIAITKYRIIVLEYDVLTRWLFRSSQLLGFSDLHYEHVESISVGTPNLSMPRLYTSISLVSLGWVLFDGYQSFGLNTEFFSLVAILMIIGGIINVFFSLPFGGVFIVIKSISGETIKIAENKLPAFFIDDLIINCRTFLTYGAK